MIHPLSREAIDAIFETATSQGDYILSLYRIAFPNFDDLSAINGYPDVSEATSKYIWTKAIYFDQRKHPNCLAGGAWMNHGWHTNPEVKDWQVDSTDVPVVRKEAA